MCSSKDFLAPNDRWTPKYIKTPEAHRKAILQNLGSLLLELTPSHTSAVLQIPIIRHEQKTFTAAPCRNRDRSGE
jgi:hypothetical protein